MLRVGIQEFANALTVKLEGRFTADDAESTRTLVTRRRDGMTLVVDLTEVTFVDSGGESVLSFLDRLGAEFVAQTSYTLDICERLNLRLAPCGPPDANRLGGPRKNASRHRGHASQPENERV